MKNVLRRGLYPLELKIYVREHALATLDDVFTLTKAWEESWVEDRYFYNYNYDHYDRPNNDQCYNHVLHGQSLAYLGAKPTTDATQFNHPSANLFVPPKAILKPPPIVQTTQQELALMDITKNLTYLEVKITKGANKQPQPTKDKTNIWCNTCKKYGHLYNERPTPKGL